VEGGSCPAQPVGRPVEVSTRPAAQDQEKPLQGGANPCNAIWQLRSD